MLLTNEARQLHTELDLLLLLLFHLLLLCLLLFFSFSFTLCFIPFSLSNLLLSHSSLRWFAAAMQGAWTKTAAGAVAVAVVVAVVVEVTTILIARWCP